jgi:Flp pilus assembly protein TadD
MRLSLSRRSPWRSFSAASCLVAVVAAGGLSGCQSFGDVTGSISATAPAPTDDAGWRAYADRWSKTYDAHPGEKIASINYARALRALNRNAEAVAIMRVAAVKSPNDYDVLGAYGKALADDGDLQLARDVLSRAYPQERPDWTIMSVQGAVEDKLGNTGAAQHFYEEALKIAPDEPTILSNLGLSYALSQKLPLAEATLRQAAASPRADLRVRQNLALVLALEGKFAEAEKVSERDMSPEDAANNVRSIQQMIAQSDSWKALQQKGGTHAMKLTPPPAEPAAPPAG